MRLNPEENDLFHCSFCSCLRSSEVVPENLYPHILVSRDSWWTEIVPYSPNGAQVSHGRTHRPQAAGVYLVAWLYPIFKVRLLCDCCEL